MYKMNDVARFLGLGDDFFTFMVDQDGDGVEEPSSHLVRKAAHIMEFAALTALIWLRLETKGRRRDLVSFGLGALAGVSDEVLQIFTHRGNELRDVFIDAFGALAGLCLVKAVSAHRSRKGRAK